MEVWKISSWFLFHFHFLGLRLLWLLHLLLWKYSFSIQFFSSCCFMYLKILFSLWHWPSYVRWEFCFYLLIWILCWNVWNSELWWKLSQIEIYFGRRGSKNFCYHLHLLSNLSVKGFFYFLLITAMSVLLLERMLRGSRDVKNIPQNI